MRRFVLAFATAAATAALASAALAADKKTLVYVVNGPSDFWKTAEAGVEKARAELPDFDLQFKYPESSAAAVQQRVLEDLVAGGASAIMVSVVDPPNVTDALNKVAEQVPLFTSDSDAPQSKRIAYIGSSNEALGEDAGKLMLKALPEGGKCVGFVGLLGADNAKERIAGVNKVIAGSKVELVDVRGDEIDQGKAKRNVEDVLVAMGDELKCVVGFYSYNTPRIYEAFKEAGVLGKIKIIGFDEDPITLGGVEEGVIEGTVVQQPFEWGYQGMKLMAAYLNGDKSGIPADGLIIVPGKVIDKSNVADFAAMMAKIMGK
jgi:ribose transport system substrate-binding protein